MRELVLWFDKCDFALVTRYKETMTLKRTWSFEDFFPLFNSKLHPLAPKYKQAFSFKWSGLLLRGSVTVHLTPCLFGLDSAALLMLIQHQLYLSNWIQASQTEISHTVIPYGDCSLLKCHSSRSKQCNENLWHVHNMQGSLIRFWMGQSGLFFYFQLFNKVDS